MAHRVPERLVVARNKTCAKRVRFHEQACQGHLGAFCILGVSGPSRRHSVIEVLAEISGVDCQDPGAGLAQVDPEGEMAGAVTGSRKHSQPRSKANIPGELTPPQSRAGVIRTVIPELEPCPLARKGEFVAVYRDLHAGLREHRETS